ncbi:MAG: hypothetical protein AAFZ74_18925 [Pseudomonadota bacterium]
MVDPSLKDIRGHHYTLAKSVSDSAIMSGQSVIWLAAKDASDALKSHSNLVPTFDHSMYASYSKPGKNQDGKLTQKLEGLKKRILPRALVSANAITQAPIEIDMEASMLRSLVDAFERFGIGPADRLLFHTADGVTYEALAALVQAFPYADLPLIHICTPYDPVGVMPNRKSSEDVQRAIDMFKATDLLGRRVFLHAENALLADHLSKTWGCYVGALELPAEPVTERIKNRAPTYRRERLATADDRFLVVSLGAARLEKGFHLIPDIIRRTFEYAGAGEFADVPADKVKFVLHASAQIIGRHPVIEKAIERFQSYSRDQVELLTEPLSDTEYRSLTVASDAVLMPYDENAYRVRGSGVVSEAIAAKKFIIAKSGSYPAEMAMWQGGAVGETPAMIAKSLLTVVKNRWQRFERVKKASEEYLSANSTQQYVQKVIRSERRGVHDWVSLIN